MPRLLIDADIIAYKVASQKEVPVKWDEDLWTLHCNEKEVFQSIDDYIESLKERTGILEVVICLSSDENFRKEVYPDYKASRADKRKPLCLKAAKEYLMTAHGAVIYEGLEADDVVGILATSKLGGVIISDDKDLKTIPGSHWDPDLQQVFTQSQEDADYQFYLQTLTGDTTDNYPGCPGIGAVKAKKLLDKCKEEGSDPWKAIVAVYEKAGFDEATALTQARCARILRFTDYNHQTKKPILWKP